MSRIKGKEEGGIRRALEATASTAGRAIIYNATAVGLGFLALVLCSFIPQIYFGEQGYQSKGEMGKRYRKPMSRYIVLPL